MHELAPNPQFVRDPWIDLTGTWRFRYDDDDLGLVSKWNESDFQNDCLEIVVPYPPESSLSGIDDPGFHPIVWYQRQLPTVPEDSPARTLIRFGAVDYQTIVWIDGVLVGQHSGGSSPFVIDVSTEWLRNLTNPVITLRVFDDPVDKEQPRGKQAWTEKHADIWYKRTTGIWQPVWMEFVPGTYIDHIRWVFDEDSKSILVDLELNHAPKDPLRATLTLTAPDGGECATKVSMETRLASTRIELDSLAQNNSLSHLLWSPGSPTLLQTRVETGDGDVVEGYIGLRTISVDSAGFRINDDPVWLRLVLSQGYFPESCYAAPSAEAIRQEVELTLALGFNGARTHQKAEDPRYLYWADKLGLMVWGEIGAAYTWSDRSVNLLTNEWTEVVRRDRNHPSIIAWVPFNESWGIEGVLQSEHQRDGVRSVYALTKSLDETRPVIGNDGWEHVATDVFSLHDYHWEGEELSARYANHKSNSEIAEGYAVANKSAVAGEIKNLDELPLMITEYGGVSFAPDADQDWYGYGRVGSDEQFVEKYRELTLALQNSSKIVGICYTQLTDTEQETNGLLLENRVPKIDLKTLSAITRGNKN